MLFSSLTFLFLFLPIVLLGYFAMPSKAKNAFLLLASFIFYAWGGVSYSLILIFSIIINFIFVRKIGSSRMKSRYLKFGIAFNVLILVVFKYLDFFIDNINAIGGLFIEHKGIDALGIALPLGISFFTFQQMSMLWDVYRNQSNQFRISFIDTALYVSLFPQLVAGPIVRYHQIIDQIKSRTHSVTKVEWGVRRFILGLFKKVVLANTCALIADDILALQILDLGPDSLWLAIIAYSMQIYFDFSGYSDMAIGLGKIFGFDILENFNFPYISRSIKEFWRRWHISLSSWFRDYVYFPLGGNRLGNIKTYRNLILVFLLTGFWHGATWSFVFWGLFHGFFIVLERLGLEKILQRIPKVFGNLYTLLVVIIAWVFFRIENFGEAIDYVIGMFSFSHSDSYSALSFLDPEKMVVLVVALLSSTRIFQWFIDKIEEYFSVQSVIRREFTTIGYLILLFLAIIQLNSGTYNPFIYFRF